MVIEIVLLVVLAGAFIILKIFQSETERKRGLERKKENLEIKLQLEDSLLRNGISLQIESLILRNEVPNLQNCIRCFFFTLIFFVFSFNSHIYCRG